MKAEILFKKEKALKGQKDFIAMLNLKAVINAKKKKEAAKKKLNVGFAIDISGSMGASLVQQDYHNPFLNRNFADLLGNGAVPKPIKNQRIQPQPYIKPDHFAPTLNVGDNNANLDNYLNGIREVKAPKAVHTRLSLVVEATKKAIMRLTDEDFASITLFDHNVVVLCPAAPMTNTNKLKFLEALQSVMVSGSTNVHGGWTTAVAEVSKNLASDYINRVILLTDGQTNAGECNADTIASHVMGVYSHSVSTSTIGVGQGFNEDLLQSMSSSGGGNSYYIETESDIDKTFEAEFSGLSTVVASEIRVSVITSEGLTLEKNMNMYKKDGEDFILPTLSSSEINALFVFSVNPKKEEKNKTLKKEMSITFNISFKDTDGKTQKLELSKPVLVGTPKVVNAMDEREDVKVQEVLNTVAETKVNARNAYRAGDIVGASNMLAESAMFTSTMSANLSASSTSMLSEEISNLNSLSARAVKGGDEALAKSLSYQSYNLRNSQK